MATPEILEFERLLRPISDDSPSGVELKEDGALRSVYQGVKDARESASSAERALRDWRMQAAESADQQTAPPPPPQAADWNKVYELATEAIARIRCALIADQGKGIGYAAARRRAAAGRAGPLDYSPANRMTAIS